jgi:hypothetical protein
MGPAFIIVGLILPLVAGVEWWPWYLFLISAAVVATGLCLAYPLAATEARIQSGKAFTFRLLTTNSVACAALFGVGRLIHHLWR